MGHVIPHGLKITLKFCLVWGWWCVSSLSGSLWAAVITGEEVGTGRLTWEWHEGGVSLRLLQLLPDQTRAFYQGRGFSSEQADIIAKHCLFQTIFRNEGTEPITYDLDEWRITHQGGSNTLLSREHWRERWRNADVSQAARIAMEWALLPTQQRFEPGDYNWGMTSYGLAPGAVFDLTLVIRRHGEVMTARIPGIVCAADHPRP
jgi:hypothetical protein